MGLFGIGDGKVDLTLKSMDVSPGGTLEGTATFNLKADVKGKGVFVKIFAERQETRMINGSSSRQNVLLYKNEVKLDGEKLYAKASSPLTYDFKMVIPNVGGGAMSQIGGIAGGGTAGAIGNLVGAVSSMIEGSVKWFVEVKLEMPLGIPISKKQQINVV